MKDDSKINELTNKKINNIPSNLNINDIFLYIKDTENKLENKIHDILSIISIKYPECKDNDLLSEIKKKETNFDFQIEKINNIEKQNLKINDRIISQELKLDKLKKEIEDFITSIDKTIKEHFTYPGIIGKFSKFKNIPDFLCYVNDTLSILVNFKDKISLDYNSYIKENNNNIKQINFRVEEFSRTNINFFNKSLNDHIRKFNESYSDFKKEINEIKNRLEECKRNNKKDINEFILENECKLFEAIISNEPIEFISESNNELEIKHNDIKKQIKEHNFFSNLLKNLLYKSWNDIQNQMKEIKDDITLFKAWREREQKKNKRNRILNSSEKKTFIISKDKDFSGKKIGTLNISKSNSNLPNSNFKKTLQPNYSRKNLLKKEETKISFMVPENQNDNNNLKNNLTKSTDNINNIKVISSKNKKNNIKNKLKPNLNNESFSDEENISPNSNLESNQISTDFNNNNNQTYFYYKKNNDKVPQIQINKSEKYEMNNNGNRRNNPIYTHKFKDTKISIWNSKNKIIEDKNTINREINRNKTEINNMTLVNDFFHNSELKKSISKEKYNKIPIDLSYSPNIGKKLSIPKYVPLNPGN